MRIQDLGAAIRAARLARGLTQARLAAEAGVSRKTLNLLENGRVGDLGVRKVLAVLEKLGVELRADSAHEQGRRRKPDYVRMACTSASVSYRAVLTEEELIHALLTGRVPAGRQAHIHTLLDEAPPALLAGLAAEAARWTRPGKLERNLMRLAREVGASRKVEEWLKSG